MYHLNWKLKAQTFLKLKIQILKAKLLSFIWPCGAEDFAPDLVPSLEKTLTRSDADLGFDDDELGGGGKSTLRPLPLIVSCKLLLLAIISKLLFL